jgi:hypothetical protein
LLAGLESTTSTKPILISKATNADFAALQRPLYKVIVHLVERFDDLAEWTNYPKGVERILKLWEGVPFQPGSYRTDFVLDEEEHPWLIEITNRMAFNGYFHQGIYHEGTRAFHAQRKECAMITAYEGFIDYFMELLNGKTDVVFLVGEDQRNESWYLTQFFPTIGIQCHKVPLEDIPHQLELMDKSMVISELGLEEIMSMDDATLVAMRGMQVLNDFRSTLLVHDKHFFTLLSNPRVLRKMLTEPEAQLVERFCAPTVDFPPAGSPLHAEISENKGGWIIKPRTLGKGQNIYAGFEYTEGDWRRILHDLDHRSYIAQRMVTQKCFTVELPSDSIQGYLSGTLLYYNERFFGPGTFRVSTEKIQRVGQRVKAHVMIDA